MTERSTTERQEHFAARAGRELLERAGFSPDSGQLPAISREDVLRCTHVASLADGNCGVWSLVNALPRHEGKTFEEKARQVRSLNDCMYDKTMERVFGEEWEERSEERMSETEAALLRSNCFEGDRFERCPKCKKAGSFEATETVQLFFCETHVQEGWIEEYVPPTKG